MTALRPTQLQIFGERCSGTNYVEQLLRRNVRGLQISDRYGWKHGYPGEVAGGAPDCVFVVVHRDPFDWVRSLHQRPWHAATPLRGVGLSEFLRSPWWCQWGSDMELVEGDPRLGTEMMHERDPQTNERFANVMRLRASKYGAWHALQGRVAHFMMVRYEEVRAHQRVFLRDFARRFGLFRWPWVRAVKDYKGGSERFVPKRYEPIAAPDLDWIAAELDREGERAAGYDVDACRRRVAAEGVPSAT